MKYAKLRGRIRETFGTQEAFALAMNVHPATISCKLNGATEWNRAEIVKAAELLNIPLEDIWIYFLR